RIVRYAAHFPNLERTTERDLHHILGERQVVHAEDAGEGGDHARRFATEEMLVELHRAGPCDAPATLGRTRRCRSSEIHLHHGTHFDGAIALEDGTSLGELGGLRDVACLDDHETADEIFHLGEG